MASSKARLIEDVESALRLAEEIHTNSERLKDRRSLYMVIWAMILALIAGTSFTLFRTNEFRLDFIWAPLAIFATAAYVVPTLLLVRLARSIRREQMAFYAIIDVVRELEGTLQKAGLSPLELLQFRIRLSRMGISPSVRDRDFA